MKKLLVFEIERDEKKEDEGARLGEDNRSPAIGGGGEGECRKNTNPPPMTVEKEGKRYTRHRAVLSLPPHLQI